MTGRERATYFTYRGLGRTLQLAPDVVGNMVASGIAEVMSWRKDGQAAILTENLRRVLTYRDGVAPSSEELARLVRSGFHAYTRYWIEGARLPVVPDDEVIRQFRVESGWENLVDGMAAGNGVIMALPHVGSWEWGGKYLALAGYPMTSVAEVLEPLELYEWFVGQREQMGLTIVPMGNRSGGVILKTLRENRLVGLLVDRDLDASGVPVQFFGATTTMPGGPATLALRTGAPILPTVVYSGPGRSHTAIIGHPVSLARTSSLRADVQRVTQDIATRFETFIMRAPEQWHMFQPIWSAAPVPDASVGDPAAQ